MRDKIIEVTKTDPTKTVPRKPITKNLIKKGNLQNRIYILKKVTCKIEYIYIYIYIYIYLRH